MDNKKTPAATIISLSRPTSWSQAYAAGNLFAVVSLIQSEANVETDTLGVTGKEILNTLEAEYFTLETKDLSAIQNAITIAIKHIVEKKDIVISACFASIVENALYVFALGGAKAYMKRKDKLGLLLSRQEPTLSTTSGFLQANDLIILQTQQFGEVVSKEKLTLATERKYPSEIAENLSPLLHEYEKGDAAAVVFSYTESQIDMREKEEKEEEKEQKNQPPLPHIPRMEKNIQALLLLFATFKHHLVHVKRGLYKRDFTILKLMHIKLTRKKKIFLCVGVLLVILLITGIIFTTKQKETAKQQALFQEVFSSAQKKFDEAQSLSGLNKNFSRDNFTQAQKLILENKEKFANNKTQKEKLDILLKDIEDGLSVVSGVNKVDAKPADVNANTLLSIALANNPNAISQDDKTIYTIDNKAIISIDKKTKSKKTLLSNKDSWKTVGGLGAYIGNIYVLDKDAGQIFKFVGSNQNNYLNSKQDLSKATSIAIDGSIWVLYSDGTIQKWTRGKQDSFTVSALDKPFNNPTRIFTDTETNNVYILDNGNSRIVVLGKSGVYQTQYQTEILKTATEFDVMEKEKKIFVLNRGKIWQIDIK